MKTLSDEELKGLEQLEEGDGLEKVESISLNELHIGVFYDDSTDRFTVDVFEIDQVTARYEHCNGREALEVVMQTVEEAWNG